MFNSVHHGPCDDKLGEKKPSHLDTCDLLLFKNNVQLGSHEKAELSLWRG